MSDRMSVEIEIGGPVPTTLVDPLIAAINAEGLCLGWDEATFDATTARDLLELAKDRDQPSTLKLVEHEVAGGQLDILEAFLVKHGIAFDRWTEAKYEYDADLVQFRPGMKEPAVRITTASQEPVVVLSLLRPVQEALGKADLQGALRLLNEAMGPEIPALEPLCIVGGDTGSGELPRPDVEIAAQKVDGPAPSSHVTGSFTVPGLIDWAALAMQKRWLLSHAERSQEAAGLVELLDAIQDAAVDQAGEAEATVFPELQATKEEDGNFHRDDGQ